MQEKSRNFFWPSYVDLFTALFAAVLVLFVMSYKLYRQKEYGFLQLANSVKIKQDSLELQKQTVEVLRSRLERVELFDKMVTAMDKQNIFTYDSVYKRFLIKDLVGKAIFDEASAHILPNYAPIALQAGRSIRNLVDSFSQNKYMSFVVIIDGNTARYENGGVKGTVESNYILSYQRSLALRHLWSDNGIIFPANTELICSGSGVFGVGRDTEVEGNNKRFIIQVIPKIKK